MRLIAVFLVLNLLGCAPEKLPAPKPSDSPVDTSPPSAGKATPDKGTKVTADEAAAFMTAVEAELLQLWIARERADWVKSTHITHDTGVIASQSEVAVMKFIAEKARAARQFEGLELDQTLSRKFALLKRALTLPAPSDAAKRGELAGLKTKMESMYGKGSYCLKGQKAGDGKCPDLGVLSDILAKKRDYAVLLDVWQGWRQVGAQMKADYARYAELANEGAREMGYADLGALWRSNYDMSPDDFGKEVDRLWSQVEPLYKDLHCHMRAKLGALYGADKVPAAGAIPAHLLGNMWAQDWSYLADLMLPEAEGDGGFDLAEALKDAGVDERKMVKIAEDFFVSVGLDPLPESFWQRSMFVKPQDREVVCHASAWDIDWVDDLRIKMCIKINEEDFITIHHELGHNYYQRAYKALPTLFTNSANDGFHEALGDTIALSVTPSYLRQIGLMKESTKTESSGLNALMRQALGKVAFLPFGVVIDKWRWQVFSGELKPEQYNAGWWTLRRKYQGVAAPIDRPDAAFDPGAKYHIPGNVPYIRYFLAHILQFQFHRALCEIAGHKGPLHTCSIYGNKAAGKRLNDMMTMGMSQPWPDALEALTGTRQMDATAIIDYFRPLHNWLKEQNKGRVCGW